MRTPFIILLLKIENELNNALDILGTRLNGFKTKLLFKSERLMEPFENVGVVMMYDITKVSNSPILLFMMNLFDNIEGSSCRLE